MTIRYKCDSCSSKLTIKEELAGTKGKCPKCQTPFIVPLPVPAGSESDAVVKPTGSGDMAKSKSSSGGKGRLSAKEKITAKSNADQLSSDDEFDPVAFLMEDDPAPIQRSGVSPLSDDEIPMDLELQMSDDEPRRRNRSQRRVNLDSDTEMRLGSAAKTADAMLSGGGGSASAARDLLTRTVEESRARSLRLDDDKPKEPSVAGEIAYELFNRGLPGVVAIAVVSWFLYQFVSGMMTGPELPDLGRVTGIVTLDGEPLVGARVTFRPLAKKFKISETRSIKVRYSRAFTDREGRYKLEYAEDIPGAVVGEHLVKISKREGPYEIVPVRYSGVPQEKRAIGHGSQELNFTLESGGAR